MGGGYGAAALGPRTHEKNLAERRDERSAAEKHCQKLACLLGDCAARNTYDQSKCNGIAKEYRECISGFIKSLESAPVEGARAPSK
jgi:hypothetical protein